MNFRWLLAGMACAPFATALAVPRTACAQDTAAPPVPAVMPPPMVSAGSPRTWLVDGGAVVFVLSYASAVVVGASSSQSADRFLFVPVAGPWVDLARRPSCAPSVVCTSAAPASTLLLLDGVFQALGAASFVGGLLTSEPAAVQPVADPRPTLRVAPVQLVGGGYGVLALGSF